MTVAGATAPLDALGSLVDGRYEDDLVVVRSGDGRQRRAGPVTHSAHFARWWEDGRLHLDHRLGPDQIDNDLAGLLATEVFASDPPGGSGTFERLFTGVVVADATDVAGAWERFYRNTLQRLEHGSDAVQAEPPPGSLGAFAPVHRHAAELLAAGSVLEVGCCFGFLSLQLAATGRPIMASDLCTGTIRLLSMMAPRLGRRVVPVACDARQVPLPDRSVDTVVAAHVLEHLDPVAGQAVVDEAVRVARRRVVIAVPYEDAPSTTFGHVRIFTAGDLGGLARRWTTDRGDRWSADVHSCHGGWLVMDRRP